MTRAQARAWKARWRAVDAAMTAELRAKSPEATLREAARLREAVRELTRISPQRRAIREAQRQDSADLAETRRRWIKLKKLARGR